MITAALSVLKLFFNFGAFIKKMVFEHPKLTISIIVLAVAGWYLYQYAHEKGVRSRDAEVAKLHSKIDGYEDLLDQQKTRIDELEKEAKDKADKNETALKELNLKLSILTNEYLGMVEDRDYWMAQNSTRQVTTISVDGKNVDVRTQDGKVVCDQFYDEYVMTINKMVDETNATIRGGK